MEEELEFRLKKLNFKVNVTLVIIIAILLVLIFATASISAKVDAMFTFVVKAIPLAGVM